MYQTTRRHIPKELNRTAEVQIWLEFWPIWRC